MSSLSPYQSASLGQGVQGVGNAISTIFDPRIQMQAQQARLANEANALEAKYKPDVYRSQIAQNNASAAAAAASAEKYRAETEAARQRAAFGQSAANLQAPQGVFPGVPYAPDVVAPPSPQVMQSFQDQRALYSNLYGGGGANDLTQGMARNAALNAQDDLAARRAAVALSGNLPNINQAFMPEFQGKVIAAQGANDIAVQNAKSQGDLQSTIAKSQGDMQNTMIGDIIKGAFGSGGSGSSLSPGMSSMKLEDLDKYVQGKFSIPGEPMSPENFQAANAYKTSMAMLMGQGVDPMTADSLASQHHGAASYSDPFFGSPRMETGKDFNMNPISPSEAADIASRIRDDKTKAGMDRTSQIMQMMFQNGQIPGATGLAAPGASNVPNVVPGTTTPAPTAPNPTVSAVTPAPATFTPPQTLGQQVASEKKSTQRKKDVDYNKATMESLRKQADSAKVPLDQIIATAMAGGQENKDALERALAVRPPSVTTSFGQSGASVGLVPFTKYAGPSINDIQNAARDPEIQKMFGINPDLVNNYLQTGNAGQTQVGRFTVTPQ